MPNEWVDFIRESNKIEGILRDPTDAEIDEFDRFMLLEEITLQDLERFVSIYQPNARLRKDYGTNVRVGRFFPMPGGPEVLVQLTCILEEVNARVPNTSFMLHRRYETLHPFTDCNGRSGRMIWAWQEQNLRLGFLHRFYYQTLANI